MAAAALAASAVGGRRNDSLTLSRGASTLPALRTFGSPSIPVTVSVGFQVEFSSKSNGSLESGCTPGAKGMRSATESPSTLAVAAICRRRSSGISTFELGELEFARASHRRGARGAAAAHRNRTAAMPLPAPECTPSVSTWMSSVPTMFPRSEVVSHKRS